MAMDTFYTTYSDEWYVEEKDPSEIVEHLEIIYTSKLDKRNY